MDFRNGISWIKTLNKYRRFQVLKAYFKPKHNPSGRSTFLTHGPIEAYEKPILTELGSILGLTEGYGEYCSDSGLTGHLYYGNDPCPNG